MGKRAVVKTTRYVSDEINASRLIHIIRRYGIENDTILEEREYPTDNKWRIEIVVKKEK